MSEICFMANFKSCYILKYIFLKKGSIYNQNLKTCATSNGALGSQCDPTKTTSQCNSGLICSNLGSNTGSCLRDQGGLCVNDNNCANYLHCQLNGKCGCGVSFNTF